MRIEIIEGIPRISTKDEREVTIIETFLTGKVILNCVPYLHYTDKVRYEGRTLVKIDLKVQEARKALNKRIMEHEATRYQRSDVMQQDGGPLRLGKENQAHLQTILYALHELD